MNRLFYTALILLISLWILPTHANPYAGGGAYFGQNMAGCGNGIQVPRAVSRIEKRQKKMDKEIKALERTIDDLRETLEDSRTQYEEYEADVKGWLRSDANTDVATAAIKRATGTGPVPFPRSECAQFLARNPGYEAPWPSYCATRPGVQAPQVAGGKNQAPVTTGAAQTPASENWYFDGGRFDTYTVCNNEENLAPSNAAVLRGYTPGLTETRAGRCAKALDGIGVAFSEMTQAENSLVNAEDKLERLLKQEERLDDDKQDELDEWQDSIAEGRFSSGYCYSCENPGSQPISGWQKAAGLGMFAGISALTVFGTKYAMDQNREMGWGTSPMMPFQAGMGLLNLGIGSGFGMGFGAGGQYGGAYGGGQNGFSCSPGYGGGGPGGAFGNPYGNPMNNGMPGMYPGTGFMPPGSMYPASMYPNGMMNPYAMMNPNGINPNLPLMYQPGGGNPMMNPQMYMMQQQQQQQMQQMYAQQMQAAMMAQQQQQQDYMQRQQLAGRLQMEMYNIQSQIAQLTGGMGGFGSMGSPGGMPYGGSMYSPYGNMYGNGAGGYFGIGGNGAGLGAGGYLGGGFAGGGAYGGIYGGGGYGGIYGGGGYATGTGGLLVPTGGTYYNPLTDPNTGGNIPARGQ